MHCMGTKYEGGRPKGRMDDSKASFEFPSHFRSEYQGGFKDGMFHGEGVIQFPDLGVKYTGKFEKGKATEGEFEFTDGLQYVIEDDWSYCDGREHREFKSEIENGLKPAGRSQLTNQHPPQSIPSGMYDCGDGFYDPLKRNVVTYGHDFLRNTDDSEHNWIVNRCRKAWDDPVGNRKIH
ncbi:MORN repeat-containing protein 5-like [Montipora foliosa]|uniref:MORN repeat-containing protein 5-like n=1 Tax=Montipora foliosa TaxID=591990 RepID=UPI0035F149B4